MVAVTVWPDSDEASVGSTNSSLFSNAVSISVGGSGSNGAGSNGGGAVNDGHTGLEDIADGSFEMDISLTSFNSTESGPLRKALKCSYFEDGRWSGRGVVLLGIDVAPSASSSSPSSSPSSAAPGAVPAIEVTAVCLSSHLSLFAVADQSALVDTFDAKISTILTRVQTLDEVCLLYTSPSPRDRG